MTDFNEHLHSELHEWRMTESEKRAMRGTLEAHMEANPLGGMVSPYSWVSFTHARQLVLVPVLVLMLGTGTSFAAQGALPGDALYPIKIHVNEAVAGALAVSDVAKASYNTQVAVERLKEAQVLAAQNNLSLETTDKLAQSYESHATLAVAYADKVQGNDAVKGAELQARLATLKAEGAVLATVADEDGSEETKSNARTLASRTGADTVEDSRSGGATLAVIMAAPASQGFAMQTMSMSVQDSSEHADSARNANPENDRRTSNANAKLEVRAIAQVAELRDIVAKLEPTLDGRISDALEVRIGELQALIESAQSASEDGEALRLYQRALSQGSVLQTFLSASKKFKRNILTPLLHLNIDAREDHESSRWNDRSSDNESNEPQSDAASQAPDGAASSSATSSDPRPASSTLPAAEADSAVSSIRAGGESSSSAGSSGSGGTPVQSLIQAVRDGLHL